MYYCVAAMFLENGESQQDLSAPHVSYDSRCTQAIQAFHGHGHHVATVTLKEGHFYGCFVKSIIFFICVSSFSAPLETCWMWTRSPSLIQVGVLCLFLPAF